jgi:hypothetical protein
MMEKKQMPAQMQPAPRPPLAPGQPSAARRPEQKPRPLAKLGLVIGGAILALAVGAGLYINHSGAPADQPTPAQIAEMSQSWEAAQRDKVSLPLVQPEEQAEALAGLNLPEEEKEALQAEIAAERVSLVWLTLWDNYAEDGDVVALHSEGLNITVPLFKAPVRIALPRPAGGVINLTGVRDGGGGITLGLMSGPDQVLIPPLAPGQVVGIPVR